MNKKSLLTLALLAFVGIVSAQTLRFEWEGNIYQDGQTIISEYEYPEYVVHLKVRNLTDNDMNVIIEREIIEEAPGAMSYFCWGQCLNPDINVSPYPIAVSAQALSDQNFDAHVLYTEGETGITKVKYYAFDRSNPDNRTSIIILAGATANVEENSINLSNAYPNPASSLVHFDYKSSIGTDINVTVYNLLGQEVKSQLVNGTQGRVSIGVDDLQPGIYFCRFSANGEVVKTEKFIVKR